eukprot:2263023-Amphidinium_carterae.1
MHPKGMPVPLRLATAMQCIRLLCYTAPVLLLLHCASAFSSTLPCCTAPVLLLLHRTSAVKVCHLSPVSGNPKVL